MPLLALKAYFIPWQETLWFCFDCRGNTRTHTFGACRALKMPRSIQQCPFGPSTVFNPPFASCRPGRNLRQVPERACHLPSPQGARWVLADCRSQRGSVTSDLATQREIPLVIKGCAWKGLPRTDTTQFHTCIIHRASSQKHQQRELPLLLPLPLPLHAIQKTKTVPRVSCALLPRAPRRIYKTGARGHQRRNGLKPDLPG